MLVLERPHLADLVDRYAQVGRRDVDVQAQLPAPSSETTVIRNPRPGGGFRTLGETQRKEGGTVFVELMPLLAGRTVMITVAREDENTLRVNVIPATRKLKEDENPALSTPLSYTGTPEELDAELGKHLASYVECHTRLGSTLAQAKAEMAAAAKAAQEEARKKTAERSKKPVEKPAASATSTLTTDAAPASTMTLFPAAGTTPEPANPTTTATAAVAAAAGGNPT